MEQLTKLLKMTQEELKMTVYNYLLKQKMNPVYEDGFVYAEGEIPILLVAHMDTVFTEPPKKIFYSNKNDQIFNPDGGLGGDDRSGVYAIMKLLEKYRPYILFTEDEEFMCLGAYKAVYKLSKPQVKYIIEFDRQGNNDCVFYECGNEKFIEYIESFGFITNYGTRSDISILGKAWDIAAVNLSSGYYYEHTENEYIIFQELINTINRSEYMLKMVKDAPYFDYQDIRCISRYTDLYDKWKDKDIFKLKESPKKLILKPNMNSEDEKGGQNSK